MDCFNYKKMKCVNNFYRNLLGYKFDAKFLNICLTRRKSRDHSCKGTVTILSDDKEVYKTTLSSPRLREEFLFAFAFFIREYENLKLIDTIGFSNPILEDLCKSVGIKYICSNGFSSELKEYLYETRMYECYS